MQTVPDDSLQGKKKKKKKRKGEWMHQGLGGSHQATLLILQGNVFDNLSETATMKAQ